MSRLYKVWSGIVQRCYNPKAKNYHNYGGRGITMFEPWRRSFVAFESYCLAKGWKQGLQVDRIDNDDGYYPGNIRLEQDSRHCRFDFAEKIVQRLEH